MIHSDQFRKCAFLFIHINVANIILFLVSFQNFVYIYTIICLYTSIFFHFTQSSIDFRPRFNRFLLLIQLEQEIWVFVTDELKLKKKKIFKKWLLRKTAVKKETTPFDCFSSFISIPRIISTHLMCSEFKISDSKYPHCIPDLTSISIRSNP